MSHDPNCIFCKIAEGKISLDLQYKIRDSKLEGSNQIVIDKLTLGERVDSPDALKLLSDTGINSVANFPVNMAKQFVPVFGELLQLVVGSFEGQVGSDTRHQFGLVERLGDVIHSASHHAFGTRIAGVFGWCAGIRYRFSAPA